jgi:diguanylate cyclase (GGDEF)-like protein/PAS domain S-box-containing protein
MPPLTPPPRSPYTHFRLRLLLGFGLLVALLIALLCWKIYSGYQSDRKTAQAQTKNFAQAMSAHVLSEIAFIDLVLVRTAEALGHLDSEEQRTPKVIRRILAPSGGAPDANFWVHFIDVRGVGVAASNDAPIAGVSYADRPYFRAHLGAEDRGLIVGTPEIGRVSKRRVFFLSRRVVSTTGEFIGVVVAPVSADVFAGVFKNALFQPTVSISLIHTDGKIIARAPRSQESFGAVTTGSELYRRVKISPSDSYEGVSPVDGQRRVFSYQTLGALPLTVAVGIASESWTNGIKEVLAAAGVGFAIILTVMVFSGHFALRSFRSLERSDADQRRLNQDLRAARDELARGEKRLRMITDSLPALVSYIDAQERYVFHNSHYRHIPGIDTSAMLGRTMREVFGDEMYSVVKEPVAAALAGERVSFERTITPGGIERHLKYEYTPDFDVDGAVVGFYTMVTDITDMKLIQARLAQLARVDSLTGLPNRNQLYERLGEALARCRRGGAQVGCLYLDIDHFKAINDSLGHAGGDEVLRQFGARLQTCVRETDLVARLAGDEFVILVEGLDQPAGGERVAAKIIEAMRPPFDLGGHPRAITTSVGVAISDGREDDADALLKKADEALYRAKSTGKNAFAVYEASGAWTELR